MDTSENLGINVSALHMLIELPPATFSNGGLTVAEQEVAQMAAKGSTNAEIALRRGTSKRTVANQMASILEKLKVGSRIGLAASLRKDAAGTLPQERTGLVEGSWSIVDRIDRDSRSYLVARLNDGRAARHHRLTARERQVTAMATAGCSLKVIAIDLNISDSAATHLLRAAMKKMGIQSRAELVRMYASAQTESYTTLPSSRDEQPPVGAIRG